MTVEVQVRVLFLGPSRDFAGTDTMELYLGPNARVADLRRALAQSLPQLAGALPTCRFAVDESFVRDDAVLRHGCEVAVIPPVSGG